MRIHFADVGSRRVLPALLWCVAAGGVVYLDCFSPFGNFPAVMAEDLPLPMPSGISSEAASGGSSQSAERPVEIPLTVPDLSHGLTYRDVIRLWGAPHERREMEAKRETVWEYGPRKVFFKEGRVVAWVSQDAMTDGARSRPKDASRPSTAASDTTAPGIGTDDETIRSILGEILEGPATQGESAEAPAAKYPLTPPDLSVPMPVQ